MIVCSCNIITRRDIERVIERLLCADPYAVLTPNLIYHQLGKRGRCCGCFPEASRILVEHCIAVREQIERGELPSSADDQEDANMWTIGVRAG
jgi:hypothetical protein